MGCCLLMAACWLAVQEGFCRIEAGCVVWQDAASGWLQWRQVCMQEDCSWLHDKYKQLLALCWPCPGVGKGDHDSTVYGCDISLLQDMCGQSIQDLVITPCLAACSALTFPRVVEPSRPSDVHCHADEFVLRCPTTCEGFSQVKLHADRRHVQDLLMLWCLDMRGPFLSSRSSGTPRQERQWPT